MMLYEKKNVYAGEIYNWETLQADQTALHQIFEMEPRHPDNAVMS